MADVCPVCERSVAEDRWDGHLLAHIVKLAAQVKTMGELLGEVAADAIELPAPAASFFSAELVSSVPRRYVVERDEQGRMSAITEVVT